MHKLHILGVAVADMVLTIVIAIIILVILSKFGIANVTIMNSIISIISLWLIAIAIHYYFCVNTSVNVFLFGER